jgi:hypothetical protein
MDLIPVTTVDILTMALIFSLTYAELFLTSAILVRRFELRLIDTTLDDVEPYKDHFVIVPKNGRTQ